jgi:alpha-galactosidase
VQTLVAVAALAATFAMVPAAPGRAATTFDPENALNRTPVMGWNSYNLLGGYWSHDFDDCTLPSCIPLNETRVKAIAQALIDTGLRDKGYVYVNIDDRWQDPRDPRDDDGALQWDPRRFPSGIPALADWLHTRGLKLGIYALPNDRPCGGEEGPTDKPGWPSGLPETGSMGHEYVDAQAFSDWGVDYIKFDWCGVLESGTYGQAAQSFELWNQAIDASGRDMLVAASTWGWENEWKWGPQFADTWRIHGDVGPYWTDIMAALDAGSTPILRGASGPTRGWNDFDALQAGNGQLSLAESRSNFIMWAVSNAPLILSNDLTDIDPALLDVFRNEEIIAVNQDPHGEQARLVSDDGGLQVWNRTLADGSHAVALLNRTGSPATITADFADLGIAGSANVRNLVNHTDLGAASASYGSYVSPRDTILLKLTPTPTGGAPAISVEFETGAFSGGSFAIGCDVCSAGYAAGWIGGDTGEVQISLLAPAVGTYSVDLDYRSGEDRRVYVSVNDGPATAWDNLNSGSWSDLGTSTFSVTLVEGYNSLRFFVPIPDVWAPDLDRIVINPV